MRNSKQWGALLALLFVLLLVVTAPAAAEEAEKTELLVTGEGEVTLRPDVAYVGLGVETQAKQVAEAQQENARRSTAVVQSLLALGVARDKIETSWFDVHPVRVYDQKGGTERLVGYRVSNRITVTLADLEKVGPVIDGAISAGANNVNDVSFSVLDTGRVKLEALRRAAAEARAKAEAMAAALGVTLGKVTAVSETTDTGPYAWKEERMPLTAGAPLSRASSTPIQAGELKLRARVTVRFALQ